MKIVKSGFILLSLLSGSGTLLADGVSTYYRLTGMPLEFEAGATYQSMSKSMCDTVGHNQAKEFAWQYAQNYSGNCTSIGKVLECNLTNDSNDGPIEPPHHHNANFTCYQSGTLWKHDCYFICECVDGD